MMVVVTSPTLTLLLLLLVMLSLRLLLLFVVAIVDIDGVCCCTLFVMFGVVCDGVVVICCDVAGVRVSGHNVDGVVAL